MNNKDYIRRMASFISEGFPENKVLVVGGPKDSGKTTGILFLSQAAVEAGYYVIHLNLKATTDSSDVKRQLEYFYSDLLNSIIGMDTGCILYNILSCPAIQRTWSAYFVQAMQLLVTMGVGGGLVYLFQKILTLRWLYITVLTVILSFFIYHTDVLYRLSFSVLQIEGCFSNGDWSTISCSLNAINKCDSRVLILFIRDIKNSNRIIYTSFLNTYTKLKKRKFHQ